MGQGITSSSDIFNLLTDGDLRINGLNAIKNMDDILLFSATLKRLNTSKFRIGEEVEFGGTIISSETVGKETAVCVLPKNERIQAFQNLKKPKSKRDVKVFCGRLASFQNWNPSIPMHITLLGAETGARGKKFEWTEDMENEYQNIRQIMKNS